MACVAAPWPVSLDASRTPLVVTTRNVSMHFPKALRAASPVAEKHGARGALTGAGRRARLRVGRRGRLGAGRTAASVAQPVLSP